MLGTALFIIYINYMPDKLVKFCKMFADDTKLLFAIETPNDQQELEEDLFDPYELANDWLLAKISRNVI